MTMTSKPATSSSQLETSEAPVCNGSLVHLSGDHQSSNEVKSEHKSPKAAQNVVSSDKETLSNATTTTTKDETKEQTSNQTSKQTIVARRLANRPEPLKFALHNNQETPLDLSVKR